MRSSRRGNSTSADKRPAAQILNVSPDLDVDLHLDSLRHPERFPLKSRVRRSAPV